jgi:hypothetical protein
MEEKMKEQNRFTQVLIVAVVLVAGVLGLHAQETSLPPPPPAGIGGRIFFTDIEEGFEGKVVVGAPFSAQAITETTQSLADGNQIHHQTTASLYRDSQGRTRRDETLGALGPWSEIETHPQQVVGINDPVSGVHYILQPAEHVAFKMTPGKGNLRHMTVNTGASSVPPPGEGPDVVFMSGSEVPPPPPGGPGGGKSFFFTQYQGLRAEGKDQAGTTESLGTQNIEGVQVTGTRTTFTIPAGQIGNEQPIKVVTERWYSPALQLVVTSKRSDPRIGVTTYRLTNINLDEPSPDLFQVPADYTVKDGPATFKR